MIQVGYDSEWFLSKAFPALNDKRIKEKINLVGICGIEDNTTRAIVNLKERKAQRELVKDYGARNILAEVASIDKMIEGLQKEALEYHHVNGDFSLPLEAHKREDRIVYICSKNFMHIGYLKDAVEHGAHIILEKPAIVLLNESGEADNVQLKELEEVIASCPESQKLIDAEHYAHKKAATIFYSKLEEILEGQKIKKVEGVLYEPDQTDKPRNLNLLNRSPSRTGLLTDTGVHLLSFIANLGASAKPIADKIKYGLHEAYNVETSVNAEYTITNDEKKRNNERDFFTDDAKISLNLEKFSGKRRGIKPAKRTKKRVVLKLEDESTVVINLHKNKVWKISKEGARKTYELDKEYDSNEYINVMNDAYDTITEARPKARSDLRDTVKTMRAIYETYKLAPITDKINIEVRY